jgi:hypothetical protein
VKDAGEETMGYLPTIVLVMLAVFVLLVLLVRPHHGWDHQ